MVYCSGSSGSSGSSATVSLTHGRIGKVGSIWDRTLLILLFVVSRRSRSPSPLLSGSSTIESLIHGRGGKVGSSIGDGTRLILLARILSLTSLHLKKRNNFSSAAR